MALEYLHRLHKGTVPPAAGRCSGALDTQDSSTVSMAATHGVLSDSVQRAGLRYLEGCDARSVAPAQTALARLAELDVPMPDGGQPPGETLRQLDEIFSPATVDTAGGCFFGFDNGGALPVSVASNWLAAAWNQNTALPLAAPATAELERIALRWLLVSLGLPASAGEPLWQAPPRMYGLLRQDWLGDVKALCGAREIAVFSHGKEVASMTKLHVHAFASGLIGRWYWSCLSAPSETSLGPAGAIG